ncbi:MAG: hypothetical protein ACR2G7_06135 [Acidimicrobiales bacterium]
MAPLYPGPPLGKTDDMAQPDPFLPDLDPASPTAADTAALARELVTAYLGNDRDPVVLRVVLHSGLRELYDGLAPSPANTRFAGSLLCSLVALLQVALTGVSQMAAEEGGDEIDVATVFEQLAASAVSDGLTF